MNLKLTYKNLVQYKWDLKRWFLNLVDRRQVKKVTFFDKDMNELYSFNPSDVEDSKMYETIHEYSMIDDVTLDIESETQKEAVKRIFHLKQ